ncbi:MAG TPA: murein biosynthesis integral membrane protein MurJ [Candidatus Binatia bacterium]|nr:murein biosynthesis integral membrane protein MurJ [Candidatus Binatia bacterium]
MIPTAAEEGAPSAPPRGGLTRSAGIVGAAVFVSRILGLVREQVFAAFFGASRELDAFITAFRIPNLFRDLFAEGALSAAFVTCFTQKLEREGDAAAWRLANLVLHALIVVVGGLVLLGMIGSPWLVDLIAPGFRTVPGKSELTVHLTRILFPFLLFVALAAVAMGMLNAKERFGVPASASSFFNLGSVVAGLACAWWLAPDYVGAVWRLGAERAALAAPDAVARAIAGMAIGTLVGGALQLVVQVPSLYRVHYRYRPMLSFSDPDVRQVLALMGPATIGAAAVQVNVLVNNNFASYLGDGAVSWLNVAFRFMQLPIGVFGVAVGVVALPAVSRRAARADSAGFADTVVRALRLVFLLCIPSAVGLAVLAPEVIGLVYEHGRFGAEDTRMAAQALVAYALGLAGYANIKVLVPAFYALGDARTPAAVSCLSIAVNALLNWLTIWKLGYGHTGLALATSTVAVLNLAILYAILRRRIGALPGVADGLWRIALASAAVGVVCVGVKWGLAPFVDEARASGRAAVVAVAIPSGVAAFAALASALGVREVDELARRFARRTR